MEQGDAKTAGRRDARRDPMPLYQDIHDDILAKIEDGTYQEGSVIPPELDLAQAYGVSRPTMRQALQLLADEGRLERRRRRGTVVTRPKIEQTFPTEVRSFADEAALQGREVTTRVRLLREEQARGEVAEALELGEGARVYHLVRLRSVDGVPNVLVESWIPCGPYPRLAFYDLEETRLYAAMREEGRPVVRVRRRLEAVRADEESASLLDVAPGDPLFLFHSVGRDERGMACEYSVARYRGASTAFEFEAGLPG